MQCTFIANSTMATWHYDSIWCLTHANDTILQLDGTARHIIVHIRGRTQVVLHFLLPSDGLLVFLNWINSFDFILGYELITKCFESVVWYHWHMSCFKLGMIKCNHWWGTVNIQLLSSIQMNLYFIRLLVFLMHVLLQVKTHIWLLTSIFSL